MPELANAMPTYLAMTSVGFISSSPALGVGSGRRDPVYRQVS